MISKRAGAAGLISFVVTLAIISGVAGVIRDGRIDDTDWFDPATYTEVRQPLSASGLPHGQQSTEYVRYMGDHYADRFGFSYREAETAQWIVEELLAMGYTWDNIEVQAFKFEDVEFFQLPVTVGGQDLPIAAMSGMMPIFNMVDASPFVHFGFRASGLSQNVILTVPGQSEEVIVVGGHYDAVMKYPGASDNASGPALLLESAQRMIDADNYYTIQYVFFGAEEVGIVGATYYVQTLSQQEHDNILFMLNADVLLEGPDLFYMGGYDDNKQAKTNHITETWDRIAEDLSAQHGFTLIPWTDGIYVTSDHLVFLPKGHTVMFLTGLVSIDGWEDSYVNDIFMDMTRVLHSTKDDFYYINNAWPEKISDNMRGFSLFLEEILLASYN